ncbi:hypothetical protein BT67DRAFT_441731 [Trichocladium antarcticum]|uniref:Secreted protein n=1 Tax=Trichocladium antarcticum TaxID=1450529 RepID=A0AAN6UKG3_9PEZI|nr:hypothetical protein BT67DRAFT_441731 [Trichocladium antarcticum]
MTIVLLQITWLITGKLLTHGVLFLEGAAAFPGSSACVGGGSFLPSCGCGKCALSEPQLKVALNQSRR